MTATTISITMDEFGQILLPLEVNQLLKLQNYDWLRVSIKSDCIVLTPSKSWLDEEVDEELIKVLVHEGILIDVE